GGMAGAGPSCPPPHPALGGSNAGPGPGVSRRPGAGMEKARCAGLRLRPLVDAGKLFLLRDHRPARCPPGAGNSGAGDVSERTRLVPPRRISPDCRRFNRMVLAHHERGLAGTIRGLGAGSIGKRPASPRILHAQAGANVVLQTVLKMIARAAGPCPASSCTEPKLHAQPLWRWFQLADLRRSGNEYCLNFYPPLSLTGMPF